MMLQQLGFDAEQATRALEAADGMIEQAAAALFDGPADNGNPSTIEESRALMHAQDLEYEACLKADRAREAAARESTPSEEPSGEASSKPPSTTQSSKPSTTPYEPSDEPSDEPPDELDPPEPSLEDRRQLFLRAAMARLEE